MHTSDVLQTRRRGPKHQPGRVLGLTFLLLAVVVSTAAAQEGIVVTPELPDLQREPVLTIEDGVLMLSLQDAIAIALDRNLSLVVERYTREEADLVVQQNMGIYDVFGTADLSYLDETSATASSLEAGVDVDARTLDQQTFNLGVNQLVSTGGTWQVDFRNTRQDSNSLFATLNPSYRSDLDFSFVQPLLRNRGALATERGIRIARTNSDISRENFELQVAFTIRDVAQTYWDLIEAQEQLKVAKESLELAIELHEQNKIRVEVGTLAPLELVQSEAGVATREEQIIRARALVGDREDLLRQLLNLDQDGLWSVPISPTTELEAEEVTVDLEEAINTALAERPELRGKRLSLENQRLDVDYFLNQKKPQLDLAVTYGLNGIGGNLTERDFITQEILRQEKGGYGDAMDQILNGDFEGWRVALNLTYPFQNRTGRAQAAIADVALDRAEAELRDLELAVITEVRRVSRALEAAAEAVQSASVTRRLEERNYEAEQKRYDNGMSTSFQVLQIQEDLTEAASRYVSSVTAYRKAAVLFYRATGRLIERIGVQIIDE